jgi:hypothetical protein
MTKPPRRYQPGRWTKHLNPDGQYAMGLPADMAKTLGDFVTSFSHLEQTMLAVLGGLMGDVNGDTVQPIWASIRSNRQRYRLMKDILETHRLAKDFGNETDLILEEFNRLIDLRNSYVHGLWQTHVDLDQVYLTVKVHANGDLWTFQPARTVDDDELTQACNAIFELSMSIYRWKADWLEKTGYYDK